MLTGLSPTFRGEDKVSNLGTTSLAKQNVELKEGMEGEEVDTTRLI